jgi:phage internal scaffolding protein
MFVSRYGPKNRVVLDTGNVSYVQRQFGADANINAIMTKYRKTGLINYVNAGTPRFGDFSNVVDYQTALNSVLDVQERFQLLPADVRKRFANDPAGFLEFVQDPSNQDELVRLGLASRKSGGGKGDAAPPSEASADRKPKDAVSGAAVEPKEGS